MAAPLDYATKDGGLGVDACPNCGEHIFVIEGRNPDGAVHHGYCMNPECRFASSYRKKPQRTTPTQLGCTDRIERRSPGT